MKKLIFIRNDDVFKYENSFLSLFYLCKKLRIPVVYGVVPKLIEKKIVIFLNREKKANPDLLDIAQHGWRHKNYNKNIKKKYEFGPLRSYLMQKRDILKGYRIMKNNFSENFTPAFIPPFHGYNQNTLKIINELKLPVFSAGNNVNIKNRYFLDLPARISLNNYDQNGNPLIINSAIMIKKILAYIENNLNVNANINGLVLHHRAITNKEDLCQIRLILSFLKKLEKQKIITFVTFSKLLAKN